jgi:hypothetical protein
MTKVVSAVGKPFRAIGRILLGLLRLLGKPLARVGRLRGKARIVVFAIIAIVIVGAVLALRPAPYDTAAVRDTLERYAAAKRDKV